MPADPDLARRLASQPARAVRKARRLLNSRIERRPRMLSECARAQSDCFDTDEHRAALDEPVESATAASSPRQS